MNYIFLWKNIENMWKYVYLAWAEILNMYNF